MTEDQIKDMVDRFLRWRLPKDFNPDGGISFRPTFQGINGEIVSFEPTGTNLFTASQAEAMVRHMLRIENPDIWVAMTICTFPDGIQGISRPFHTKDELYKRAKEEGWDDRILGISKIERGRFDE